MGLLVLLATSFVSSIKAQVFVSNEDANTVSVVDPTTNVVLQTITVGVGPSRIAISPNRTRAYTSNTNDGTVTVIGLTAFTYPVVATIAVGNDPISLAITPNGGRVYVANSDDGTVSVIDTATNLVTQTITLPTTAPDIFTPTPQQVAITPDGTRVYVTNDNGRNMYVIDTLTNTPTPLLLSFLGTGYESTSGLVIAPDGNHVYVGVAPTSGPGLVAGVLVITTAGNTLGPLIPAANANAPNGLAISPNGARVYSATGDNKNVLVIDTTSNAVVATITGFGEPVGVGVSLDGSRLYVADSGDVNDGDGGSFGSDVLVVVNTATNAITGSAKVGADPQGIAFVPFFIDAYQVRYASNLAIGDSAVDITNTGTSGSNICVSLYTFDPAEELISCCSCVVTPNGLQSLSVRNSLISNPLTPAIPTSVVIKLVASATVDNGTAISCNAATSPVFTSPTVLINNLTPGLRAWGTTLHALPTTPITYGTAETPFAYGVMSATELAHITSFCGFIQANGSGFGICKGCSAGGLGAPSAR